MTDAETKATNTTPQTPAEGKAEASPAQNAQKGADTRQQRPARSRGGNRRGGGEKAGRGARKGRGRKGGEKGGERFRPEFEQKIVDIARVSRVVAGGRRFSFRVAVVIGNRKGSVGVGLGKGTDTALAIEKAVKNARKNMITVKLTDNMSIPHDIEEKYCGSRVRLQPAAGKGLVAGSSVRNVLDLLGATDVSAKVLSRSKNKLNNARVAIKALQNFS